MQSPETQMAYSLPEAAEALRISVRKAYDEIAKGRLKTFKIGDRRLVSREALTKYIRLCEREN